MDPRQIIAEILRRRQAGYTMPEETVSAGRLNVDPFGPGMGLRGLMRPSMQPPGMPNMAPFPMPGAPEMGGGSQPTLPDSPSMVPSQPVPGMPPEATRLGFLDRLRNGIELPDKPTHYKHRGSQNFLRGLVGGFKNGGPGGPLAGSGKDGKSDGGLTPYQQESLKYRERADLRAEGAATLAEKRFEALLNENRTDNARQESAQERMDRQAREAAEDRDLSRAISAGHLSVSQGNLALARLREKRQVEEAKRGGGRKGTSPYESDKTSFTETSREMQGNLEKMLGQTVTINGKKVKITKKNLPALKAEIEAWQGRQVSDLAKIESDRRRGPGAVEDAPENPVPTDW